MNRNDFIKGGALTGAALLFNSNDVFAQGLDNDLDKLTDADGNYALQTLPYSYNHLEPHMDAETLNLHYNFHHGGAVKAAQVQRQGYAVACGPSFK